LIDEDHPELSIRRQCELVGLNRSTRYYEPTPETPENLEVMRLIDQEYTAHPFFGSRKITQWLIGRGHEVNRKRVRRLMRVMGLEAIYPKPKLSLAGRGHKVYPYLLRDVAVERVNQVWSADITYVPLPGGFMYLAATITGSAGTWWRGGCRTRSTGRSARTCWRRRWAGADRRCSTRTRGYSSPPGRGPGGWSGPGCR
jgi:hypothetical protein